MELDSVKLATLADLPQLCAFYQAVCAHQPKDEYSAKLTWGSYPSEEYLRNSIVNAQVLMGVSDHQIVSAGVLTIGEDYPTVNWPEKYDSAQVGVIHLYAVHPAFRGQGCSAIVLRALLQQAKENGQRVIHLDVLGGNVPAAKLYLRNGFRQVARQTYHYDDLGDQPAILMEYLL